VWVDYPGHWLSHTYVDATGPTNSIRGHGFSDDGQQRTYCRTEPFTSTVQLVGGEINPFSTIERPTLLFTNPTDLLNGFQCIGQHSREPVSSVRDEPIHRGVREMGAVHCGQDTYCDHVD
jgi:hypothetical protein